MDNANSPDYLDKITSQVIENLKRTAFAPSVQMTDVPRDPEGMDDEADAILDDLDEDENKDVRYTKHRWDKYVEKDGELSDSEDEDENEANGVRKQPGRPKRRNLMDYSNPAAVPDFDDSAMGTPDLVASGDDIDDPTAINAEVSAEVLDAKKSASGSPVGEGSSSNVASPDESPVPGPVDEDGDIDMDAGPTESAAGPVIAEPPTVGGQVTPPDSPPNTSIAAPPPPTQAVAAPAPTADEMDEGDTLKDLAVAKEEGREEREDDDITAEKRTEVADES